jgi:DNA-binding CsgD family transcriptional regulator
MTSPAIEDMYSRERYLALLAVVESMAEGVSVYDLRGHVLHRSARLEQLLEEDPERRRLEDAIDQARRHVSGLWTPHAILPIARATGGAADRSCELFVATERTEYHVRCSAVETRRPARIVAVIVIVRARSVVRRLSPKDLQDRFNLTPAEVRVAALIDAGMRTREIAEELRISVHTARRHAEAVLRKLGVHSRAAVGARLRE